MAGSKGTCHVKLALVFGFINLFCLFSQAHAAETFDLKKTIALAIENSPDFNSNKRKLEIAALQEKTAAARMLPSLDLSATHGIQDASPRTGNGPWASNFSLGLTDKLYDNGVMNTTLQVYRLTKTQAELNFKDQQNQLSLNVAAQFLVYSLNTKLVDIQDKQYHLVNKQYEMISRDFYQGIKTKKDYLRFKTQVSRTEIALVAAKNALEQARQELRRLIGVGVKSDRQIEFVPLSLEAVANDMAQPSLQVQEHLQYRAAQIQKQIEELNADIVARKVYPEWNVSSAVTWGSQNYLGTNQSVTDNAQWNWNALVTVTYNFFDFGIRSRDREVALQQKYINDNTIDASMLTLNSQLKQFENNVKTIQKTFTLSKELLAMEKVNFEFIEREYRGGKVQYLDLINGLTDLTSAETTFFQAASDLATAKFTLLYHQGKLYEELIK